MAAIETLPTDVLLVIIHKLVNQDLPSLLNAACASKALHRNVAGAAIWKELFCGPGIEGSDKQELEKQSAKLDAAIQALGGYKQLVAVQYAAQQMADA